jgi:hypothetical protein
MLAQAALPAGFYPFYQLLLPTTLPVSVLLVKPSHQGLEVVNDRRCIHIGLAR